MLVENSKMIYRGSGELARVYRGQTIVWERTHDYSRDYLTFIVTGSRPGVFTFVPASGMSISDIEISKNEGPWIYYSSATVEDRTLPSGSSMRVRGKNSNYGENSHYLYSQMWISGNTQYSISGNIMSLVHGDLFYGSTGGRFYRLFSKMAAAETNNNCTDAGDLVLSLPSSIYGYSELFCGCSSLVTAPHELAGTYPGCYERMFYGCSSLTSAPELPSTSLSYRCYLGMFEGCSSLATAPELPAESLVELCCANMYNGCSSLNYVKCLAVNMGPNSTIGWLNGTSTTGTFIKHPNAVWATGSSGIPSGWTVQDA